MRIKLYGERHTNTNYLSKLIELNLVSELVTGVAPRWVRSVETLIRAEHWVRDLYFDLTRRNNLGWKHTLVNPEVVRLAAKNDDLCFVTLTKNPYAWILSMFRRPYHQHAGEEAQTLEQFLDQPWQTLGRENTDSVLSGPVALWNQKNRSYLNLPEARTLRVNTETTFLDPAAVLEDMSQRFHIAKRSQQFLDYERSTKKRPGQDGAYYRDYYLNQRWRDELSDRAITMINEQLDKDLVVSYGYELL